MERSIVVEDEIVLHLEDELRAGKEFLEMEYQFNVGDAVQYKGRRMIVKEQVERHDRALPETPQLYVLQFPGQDLTRLAWEHEIEPVGDAGIRSYSESVHTEHLGEHSISLDSESGSLLIANAEQQLVLPVQEAYMLLDFLYHHRDMLDQLMHASVE